MSIELNPRTADEYLRSYLKNLGEPAGAWDTYSAGEDLLDFMEALNIKSFEDVPENIITKLLSKWDRQDAYSQDMAEQSWNPLW